MPYLLTCNCTGRYINTKKCCSKCGIPAIIDTGIEAKKRQLLDYDYECPITGKAIVGKQAHEENLRIHGKHVLEKGELEDAKRVRKALDDELDRKLEETAANFVGSLSPERKAQLEVELLSTETTIERK